MIPHIASFSLISLVLCPSALFAKESIERLSIYGTPDRRLSEPGAATVLSKEWLETYKYTDIHRVLKTVPGVQVQEEDGFGLRPNIGMRGAHPHRSRKVLFMEDGIPIGPAPYAAPAAYYVPSLFRVEGVEVSKGSSAVRYGPQTIGGAVNLLSPRYPEGPLSAEAEAAVGSFNTRKGRLSLGGQSSTWSWLLLGGQLDTDGYKRLPSGADTGFVKRDLLSKLRYRFDDEHSLGLKLGWADEVSQETYLGLSRDDFATDPYQRYAASERDQMDTVHRQYNLDYSFASDAVFHRVSIYQHRFDRLWSRLNSFNDRSISLREVLAQPFGRNQRLYGVLRGTDDSLGLEDQLVLALNDRSFLSRGVQWEGERRIATGSETSSHELAWGLRVHEDWIERKHSEERYQMSGGRLETVAESRIPTTRNKDKAEARSFYVMDTFRYHDVRLTLGVRHESVLITRDDRTLNGSDDRRVKREATMPGLGLFYSWSQGLGLLAGVHRGIALAGLEDAASGKDEESWNYEAGLRLLRGRAQVDLIGFFNDYANIKGTCSFSSGCTADELDKTFDGGQATIYGLEFAASYGGTWGGFYWPLSLHYTQTRAVFANSFISSLPDWGLGPIQDGDPLPYVPRHQWGVDVGLRWHQWQLNLLAKYQGEIYDQSVASGRETLPASTFLDAALSYRPSEDWEIYLNGDNLLEEKAIVSLRPFGARPGKPRSFMLGLKTQS